MGLVRRRVRVKVVSGGGQELSLAQHGPAAQRGSPRGWPPPPVGLTLPVEGGACHRALSFNSLADLEAFMKVARMGLTKPLKEGDYDGLVEVMGHLMKVKERQVATDNMFEPLKQTIELLKTYGEEMPEETHVKLQVDSGQVPRRAGKRGEGRPGKRGGRPPSAGQGGGRRVCREEGRSASREEGREATHCWGPCSGGAGCLNRDKASRGACTINLPSGFRNPVECPHRGRDTEAASRVGPVGPPFNCWIKNAPVPHPCPRGRSALGAGDSGRRAGSVEAPQR